MPPLLCIVSVLQLRLLHCHSAPGNDNNSLIQLPYFYKVKKPIYLIALLSLGILLSSWGPLGHQTVARIAEKHLSAHAKLAVAALLGNDDLVAVSNWADEVRPTPEYKHTAPWHYLNLPSGLDYTAFCDALTHQNTENIYTAITHCKSTLLDHNSTHEQKAEALKFLVHLVGDAHQPMHVSRAEDKGGNTIQVQFDNKGTNLHALWDSKLIEHQGKTFEAMANDYDKPSDKEIKAWQHDALMQWLFESYKISTALYAGVDKGNKLGEAYYQEQIPVVEQRIEKAGIRLAGLLNDIFENNTP